MEYLNNFGDVSFLPLFPSLKEYTRKSDVRTLIVSE